MDGVDVRRRLRAARHLAGYKTVTDLARAVNVEGLSAGTIENMEQGRRAPRRNDLSLIADACDLPVEFFTADFRRLADASTAESGSRVQEALTEIRHLLALVVQHALPQDAPRDYEGALRESARIAARCGELSETAQAKTHAHDGA